MLDTICLQYPLQLNNTILSSWGYERRMKHKGYSSIYRLTVAADNGSHVTFRYIPHTPPGYPLLQVEFSLSHLVFGNNLYVLLDIKSMINQANDLLPLPLGFPKLDLWFGILCRLDFCYNFQVGGLVPYYIKALQSLKYPRRKTRPYTDQGVQYGNNQAAMKFYDKAQECESKSSHDCIETEGILRLEITLRKNAIKKLTMNKFPTLRDLSLELAINTLEKELDILGLLARSIGTYNTALSRLSEAYGTDAGFCYFGALAASVEYPNRETIIQASGIHPRTMDRRLKKVLIAGLPLTITKQEEPLPPLSIDKELVQAMVKSGASVMNYQVIPQTSIEPIFRSHLRT